jgi:hypothetical protein
MTASPLSATRCEPGDLLSLFSPGQVIGLFQGTAWIDWSAPSTPGLEILTLDRPERLWRVERNRFHVVVDTNQSWSGIGALVECLVHGSKGVALVSSRLGRLLRWASRVVAPPPYPQRNSGPFRSRTSGAILVFRETTLTVLERHQVQDSATLSIAIPNPARAVAVLEPSFPVLQADRTSLHLPLRGHHPEEVLGRLRQEGITVAASAVWYRLLQSCPLKPLRD